MGNSIVKKFVLILALALSVSSFMCACGGNGKDSSSTEPEEPVQEITLEQYFEEHPDELQGLKDDIQNDNEMRESLKHMDFDIYAKENTFCFEYKFKDTFTGDVSDKLKKTLKGSLRKMKKEQTARIAPLEKAYGIDGIVIHTSYLNGDGTVLAERNYSK